MRNGVLQRSMNEAVSNRPIEQLTPYEAVLRSSTPSKAIPFLGEFLTYGGNAERGMQLAERAKQLNPNHPGFYWFADFYHAFSQKDYRGELAFAQKSARLRGNPLAQ
jgi:hypothetical protein